MFLSDCYVQHCKQKSITAQAFTGRQLEIIHPFITQPNIFLYFTLYICTENILYFTSFD